MTKLCVWRRECPRCGKAVVAWQPIHIQCFLFRLRYFLAPLLIAILIPLGYRGYLLAWDAIVLWKDSVPTQNKVANTIATQSKNEELLPRTVPNVAALSEKTDQRIPLPTGQGEVRTNSNVITAPIFPAVSARDSTGILPAQNVREPEAEESAYVNTIKLNVRSGPGTEYPTVARLNYGTSVRVGKYEDSKDGTSWVQINVGDAAGWVNAKLLTKGIPPQVTNVQTESKSYVKQMIDFSLQDNDQMVTQIRNIIDGLPKMPKGNRKYAREINTKALAYIRTEQYGISTDLLRDAHLADPSDVEIANNLGFSLLKSSDYKGAAVILMDVLIGSPARANAWANLGQAYAKMGDLNSAVGCLKNAYRFSKNREGTHKTFLSQLSEEDDPNLKIVLEQVTQQMSRKISRNSYEQR